MSKIGTDDYFQKLVDIKLESISKLMNDRPAPKNFYKKSKQKGIDAHDRYQAGSVQFNGFVVRKQPNDHRIDGRLIRYQNNIRPVANSNFSPRGCLKVFHFPENKNDDRHSGGANELENSCRSASDSIDSCSVAGVNWHTTNRSSDPDFRDDIVSKLKSKAIGNLLFKAKEDMNVKKLNEMKTRPDQMAEKALTLCDLKSYNEFVTELLSSGVFQVAKERSVDLGKERSQLDDETKRYANRKEMENLERMVGRVFGDEFLHRNDLRVTGFLGIKN